MTNIEIDYENPWIFEGTPFLSENIDDNFGFVYLITNLQNGRQYIGRKYFWQFRTPKGKKRKVKSESDWKKYYGSCPELKEDIERLGRQILVELSCQYIKHLGKQTTKKQGNSLPTTSLQSPLTKEYQDTTIVTSSADTSEKITMKETIEIVDHIRRWAIDQVDEYDTMPVDRIYDRFALIDEYHEWITPQDEEIDVVTLDEISKDEYDDFVDYMNMNERHGTAVIPLVSLLRNHHLTRY